MKSSQKSCYCDGLDDAFRKKNCIPDGCCGICDCCGSSGHTSHYPGPVPYTGSWCDKCYKIEGILYIVKLVFFLLFAMGLVGLLLHFIF